MYLTVSVQLVYTGLVSILMRGYREPILRMLFGNGNIPQVLFMIGTLGTILLTQATMWANVEVRACQVVLHIYVGSIIDSIGGIFGRGGGGGRVFDGYVWAH